MRDDLAAKSVLEVKYPGALFTVRYEDFVSNISRTIDRVFDHIGIKTPEGMYERIQKWSTRKKNGNLEAAKVLDSWKTLLGYEDGQLMNEYCKDVLDKLGYHL